MKDYEKIEKLLYFAIQTAKQNCNNQCKECLNNCNKCIYCKAKKLLIDMGEEGAINDR